MDFHAFHCQSQVLCFAPPEQLPFSQFDDIITGHSMFIFIDLVDDEAHRVILSCAEHPRIFALHVPFVQN